MSTNSWQVLIYSHAGLGIRRRQRAAPLNSIVSDYVLCPLKKDAAKQCWEFCIHADLFVGLFQQSSIGIENSSWQMSETSINSARTEMYCSKTKISEGMKLITSSSCQVQLKSKFLNPFFPDTDFLSGVNLFNALCKSLN